MGKPFESGDFSTPPSALRNRTFTLGSANTRTSVCSRLGGRVAGQDAAVDDRLRGLRQRVVGVAGVEPGRDAGGAQHGVVAWVRGQSRQGGGVRRRAQNGVHVGLGLRVFERRAALEIGARDGVEFHRKRRMLEASKRVGQVIDGVVRLGQGAVAARIE